MKDKDHSCCQNKTSNSDKPMTHAAIYTCPMHPEIEQKAPGSCPKCGMALEPKDIPRSPTIAAIYTCPMHPEVIQDRPGSCPKCGMALEPKEPVGAEEGNPELEDMSRRFWISLLLSLPLAGFVMGEMLPIFNPLAHASWFRWLQLALATPVVLWGGWPFFQRAWQSILHRSPNMFTLIAMGTGAAYSFSVAATLFPQIFPESFQHDSINWDFFAWAHS